MLHTTAPIVLRFKKKHNKGLLSKLKSLISTLCLLILGSGIGLYMEYHTGAFQQETPTQTIIIKSDKEISLIKELLEEIKQLRQMKSVIIMPQPEKVIVERVKVEIREVIKTEIRIVKVYSPQPQEVFYETKTEVTKPKRIVRNPWISGAGRNLEPVK